MVIAGSCLNAKLGKTNRSVRTDTDVRTGKAATIFIFDVRGDLVWISLNYWLSQ